MSIHEYWQMKRPTIRERTKFMLNNDLFSDVKFVTCKTYGDCDEKEGISAHNDEVNLSRSNVMGVLYLAKQYMVPTLAGKCTEYLQNHVDPSNVFNILTTAEKYGEKKLVSRCWGVVDRHTQVAVKVDGFSVIEKSLFDALVIRDSLSVKEVDLFRAVNSWATKKCKKLSLPSDGRMKRKVQGIFVYILASFAQGYRQPRVKY
ncbi:BTB/POZ domain-containing protein 6-like [Montipora foliosa]|uniref:BTB/POZ domain-containing protein 6-like n=1 Tax=Montipora foliosa TaxID=591990 RepID=UPI0035F194B0